MDKLELVKIAEIELEPQAWDYNDWKVAQAIADGLFEPVKVEVFAGDSLILYKYECGILGVRGVLAQSFTKGTLNITEYDLSEDYELRERRIEIMEDFGDAYVSEAGFAKRAKAQAAVEIEEAPVDIETGAPQPEDELPF